MESEYLDENAERKRKIRIVAITSLLAIVILGIGAIIIVSTVSNIGSNTPAPTNVITSNNSTNNSNNSPNNNSAASESAKSTDQSKSTESTKSAETTQPTNNTKTSSASATTPSSSATQSDIPTTGPESTLPAALLMGVAVYLLAYNYNLTHKSTK